MQKKTRNFILPNNGHGVRKMNDSLMEFDNTKRVKLMAQDIDGESYGLFVELTTEASAEYPHAIAKALVQDGTRFTMADYKLSLFPKLRLYVKQDDAVKSPELYPHFLESNFISNGGKHDDTI